MPEGHLLHRYARQMSADLAGARLSASSPQGRFDAGPVDGVVLERVEAHGKHLLHRLSTGATLHVHLGLRGLYLRHEDASTPPRGGVRLRLSARGAAWDLIAPTRCELLDDPAVDRVLARLGPDPLAPDAAEPDVTAEAVRRLRAHPGPVGAAVLDQGVWAGIGNAWRAELLFLARLDPATASAAVPPETAESLWRRAVDLLALGRDAGQVVSDPTAPDERWVYKRESCRSCGAPVSRTEIAGRTSHACPVEQAPATAAQSGSGDPSSRSVSSHRRAAVASSRPVGKTSTSSGRPRV